MKQNLEGVSAKFDDELIEEFVALFSLAKGQRPNMIVESGTYQGLGTTAMLLDALGKAFKRPDKSVTFVTIEADETNYKKAVENLQAFKWVRVIHGSSVLVSEALDFIANDEMLLNHDKYPDIKIDAADPIPFYISEVKGELGIFGGGKKGKDGVFNELEFGNKIPLFVLDSAGGIGWLEFQKVMEIMRNHLYYVWLHDTNHIKHYRSCQHIINNPDEWTIIQYFPDEWILAIHEEINE